MLEQVREKETPAFKSAQELLKAIQANSELASALDFNAKTPEQLAEIFKIIQTFATNLKRSKEKNANEQSNIISTARFRQ